MDLGGEREKPSWRAVPESVACAAEQVMRPHLGRIILRQLAFVREILLFTELSLFCGDLHYSS